MIDKTADVNYNLSWQSATLMDKASKSHTIQVWQSENLNSPNKNGKTCYEAIDNAKMRIRGHAIKQFACMEKAIS